MGNVLGRPEEHEKPDKSVSAKDINHEFRLPEGDRSHRKSGQNAKVMDAQGKPEWGSPMEKPVQGFVKMAVFLGAFFRSRCFLDSPDMRLGLGYYLLRLYRLRIPDLMG
jgi:hypothetical protein